MTRASRKLPAFITVPGGSGKTTKNTIIMKNLFQRLDGRQLQDAVNYGRGNYITVYKDHTVKRTKSKVQGALLSVSDEKFCDMFHHIKIDSFKSHEGFYTYTVNGKQMSIEKRHILDRIDRVSVVDALYYSYCY